MSLASWFREVFRGKSRIDGKFDPVANSTMPSVFAEKLPDQSNAPTDPPPLDNYQNPLIWTPTGSPFVRWLVAQWAANGVNGIDAYQHDLDQLIEITQYKAGDENLSRPPATEFKQWSPVELNLVKAYLQTIRPERIDLEHSLLIVDYLYQRYLPVDVLRADAQMLVARSSLMGKVADSHAEFLADEDAWRAKHPPISQKEIDKSNAKREFEQTLLSKGIPLSLSEFSSIILPILKKADYSFDAYSTTDVAMLYDYENSVYSIHSVAKDYFIRHNINDIICKSAALLKKSHETLNAAATLGRIVKIIVPHGAQCCLSLFDGCQAKASNLLLAYSDPTGRFPLVHPLETPCLKIKDASGPCPIRFLVHWEGEEIKQPIPTNWRELLGVKLKAMQHEQRNQDVEWLNENILGNIEYLQMQKELIDSPVRSEELAYWSIKELRSLQKICGKKGFRSKNDIAQQLAVEPIHSEVERAVRKWREHKIEFLKESIESDKEALAAVGLVNAA